MTRLHDAIAALVDPGEEQLLRDGPSIRARRAELDAEHRRHIAYLRQRHDAARARAATVADTSSLKARNAAGMRRAITAMTEAGQAHRARRDALSATAAATPSLLDQLHDAVQSTQGGGGASAGAHRAPIGLAAAELLGTIRRTVTTQHGPLSPAIRAWAADDTRADPDIAELWLKTARAILEPPRMGEGTRRCPACRTRHVWVADGDEWIRKAALQINYTNETVACIATACGNTWDKAHWPLLVAALDQDDDDTDDLQTR